MVTPVIEVSNSSMSEKLHLVNLLLGQAGRLGHPRHRIFGREAFFAQAAQLLLDGSGIDIAFRFTLDDQRELALYFLEMIDGPADPAAIDLLK